MVNKLDSLVELILDSYDTLVGINHLEGPNLPSSQSVSAIVDELETLIFPGFRDEANLEKANLKYVLGEKIARIAKTLIHETEKSLRYMCKIQDQCDRLGSCKAEADQRVLAILGKIPDIRLKVNLDVEAAFRGDPAAKSHEEIILSYPSVEAIMVYRIAHEFWLADVPLIPRMMNEYTHGKNRDRYSPWCDHR